MLTKDVKLLNYRKGIFLHVTQDYAYQILNIELHCVAYLPAAVSQISVTISTPSTNPDSQGF